jgi:WD40-like Beta Propeller Repeat
MRLRRLKKYALGAGGMVVLAALIVSGAVLAVSSAYGGPSAFPGRNGKVLMVPCKIVGEYEQCRRLAVMNPDGSRYRLLGPRVLGGKGLSSWSLRWSRDGRRLLVGPRDLGLGGYKVDAMFLLTPEGRKIKTILGSKRARRIRLGVASPDWLRGEKRVVFAGSGIRSDAIYTIGVDGTGLRKVRAFPRSGESPTLRFLVTSPDGRRIAFARVHNSDSYVIYLVNANGTGLRRLAEVCYLRSLDWFPAGNTLLGSWQELGGGQYPCGSPDVYHPPGIYRLSLRGGPSKLLYQDEVNPEALSAAAVSPDGMRVIFAVRRAESNGGLTDTITVMKADGTGVRKVRQADVQQGAQGYVEFSWQPLPR